MIIKLLIFIGVLFAIYMIFFKKNRDTEGANTKRSTNKGEEVMLECKICGTYVSDKEAIIKDGAFYCSKECAKG